MHNTPIRKMPHTAGQVDVMIASWSKKLKAGVLRRVLNVIGTVCFEKASTYSSSQDLHVHSQGDIPILQKQLTSAVTDFFLDEKARARILTDVI